MALPASAPADEPEAAPAGTEESLLLDAYWASFGLRRASAVPSVGKTSTAIPTEMPYASIGKSPYVDGGMREIAPLGRATEDGAE